MYILDFAFNENTGETNIVVDFYDESMTTMEMNLAIRDGEIRENVTQKVGEIFGSEIENKVRSGEINLVCLDDHPEEKEHVLLKNPPTLENNQEEKKENLI